MEPVYEIIGYAASALIVVSLAMTSHVRLRVVNLAGSVLFLVYGVLIAAWPIVATNAVIIAINTFFLVRVSRKRPYLSTLAVSPDARYLNEFLAFHRDDIVETAPDFAGSTGADVALLVLYDMEPAGAFIADRVDSDRLRVRLDWVRKEYRDFKLGRHLFGPPGVDVFHDLGIAVVESSPGGPVHRRYLEKVGFVPVGDDYVLDVGSR